MYETTIGSPAPLEEIRVRIPANLHSRRGGLKRKDASSFLVSLLRCDAGLVRCDAGLVRCILLSCCRVHGLVPRYDGRAD